MQATDLRVGIIEEFTGGEIITLLSLTNLSTTTLDNQWRLYFSLGLKPVDGSGLHRVIIEGRYGFLAPGPDFVPLNPGETRLVPIENWLFSGMKLVSRQGFHVSVLRDGEETLLGEPDLAPPVLQPLTSPRNRMIRTLSPAARLMSSPLPPRAGSHRPEVVPAVKEFAASGEVLIFDGLTVEADGLANEANRLQDILRRAGVRTGSKPCRLSLDQGQSHDYEISIDGRGVEITGRTNRDVFYGIQTLRQYLSVDDAGRCRLPPLKLSDTADFEHRALCIDIARHYQPASQLRKTIEAMAAYKMNRLQLGISNDEGWRLEIAGLPWLTTIGARRSARTMNPDGTRRALYPAWGDNHEDISGHLTANEFIELLQFAASRHVEIILELNMPGHANALIRSLEDTEWSVTETSDTSDYQSAQGYRNNVVNVGLTTTYRLLERLLREFKAMYSAAGVPFRRVHLGGDEVPEGAWLQSHACMQLPVWQPEWDVSLPDDATEATAALMRYHLQRSLDIAENIEPGIEVGFWHEMAPFGDVSGNAYYTTWVTELGQREVVEKLLSRSQSVVICNASYLYLDMPYVMAADEPGLPWASYIDTESIYRFDPLGCWGIPEDKTYLVTGIQAQLWTETVFTSELMDYYLFPRLLAVAERAWNRVPAGAAWPGFAAAVANREMPYLRNIGISPRPDL